MAISTELKCSHCGIIFTGTTKQAYRAKYSKTSAAYCSPICRTAAASIMATAQAVREGKKAPELKGPCPICGEKFISKTAKTYCSLKCYNKSPKFKEMILTNFRKGTATTQKKWEEKMTKRCPVCGQEFRADRSHRQFCSRICYRRFKAELYDAWIANPQQLTLPQCYDEFMLQDELPCLIEGCQWKGKHLSIHLNSVHGVKAADFKRAAGFNLNTGLVAPSLHLQLSNRDKQGVAVDETMQGGKAFTTKGLKRTYVSLEGIEHRQKARMDCGTGPARICVGCGSPFRQATPYGKKQHCTKECRDTTYSANGKTKRAAIKAEKRKQRHSSP